MKRKNRTILIGISSILVITLLTMGFVSAEFWMCFSKGQAINFCNPQIPDRTASADNYRMCMKSYDEANNCYSLGSWNVCNSLAGAGCGGNGDGGEIDSSAPTITINSPVNGSIYPSRKVDLSVALNEQGKIEYEDLVNGRGRCSILCKGCSSMTKSLSFKEGENYYKIKATDLNGNEAFTYVKFFVDSQKPRIHIVEPKKGFASGNFVVQYTEDNLENITITYGNSLTGYNTTGFNMSQCASGKKQSCSIDINLAKYEGQEMEYTIYVEDIAGNKVASKTITLDVDSSFPKINSLDYTINGKKVSFIIAIDEDNIQEVNYVDNSNIRPKEKRMCSRLIDGKCKADVSFSSGQHSLTISVLDKAGNMLSQNVDFTIA